jgi:hypothetical protein
MIDRGRAPTDPRADRAAIGAAVYLGDLGCAADQIGGSARLRKSSADHAQSDWYADPADSDRRLGALDGRVDHCHERVQIIRFCGRGAERRVAVSADGSALRWFS